MEARSTARPKLHAEKRSFTARKQPLKPSNKKAGIVVFSVLFAAALSAAFTLYFDEIEGYVNRPVVKVRRENQWLQVSETEVGKVLSEFMGAGFFSLDTAGIKKELEQMSWVEFASVKRVWPDTLSIELQEEKAIARWGDNAYLNQTANVFQPDKPAHDSALPQLNGPQGSQLEVMNQYLALSQLLLPQDIRLSELALSDRGNWELILNDSVQVSAGKEKAFENLNRFVTVLVKKQAMQLSEMASVDLRYRNGFAIKTIEQELSGVAAR